MVWLWTLASVLAVSAISLIGILALSLRTETLKSVLIYMVSFWAGALLGDAFIHLLPEAIETAGGMPLGVGLSVLLGVVSSFAMEKLIHWRHCHLPSSEEHVHPFALMNLFGDAVHNLIDGMVIAASYLASFTAGFATTVAVVLHELPQEVGDFGVLLHGGFSRRKALALNFLTALAAVLGAVVVLLAQELLENLSLYLVPFAAGGFIYIAGSDLIPELHKEVRPSRSLLQLLFFLLGVGVMVALLGLG